MVVATFGPSGPIIIGLDHMLERRRGLRWRGAMALVEAPFADRI